MSPQAMPETAELLVGKELTFGPKEDRRTIVIGRLSTRQLLRIMRLAGAAYRRMSNIQRHQLAEVAALYRRPAEEATPGAEPAAEEAEAAEAAKAELSQQANQVALSALLEVLDEATVGDLLAILTGQEAVWCLDRLGLLEDVQILEALAEQEQLGEVVAAFQRVVKGWQPPTRN